MPRFIWQWERYNDDDDDGKCRRREAYNKPISYTNFFNQSEGGGGRNKTRRLHLFNFSSMHSLTHSASNNDDDDCRQNFSPQILLLNAHSHPIIASSSYNPYYVPHFIRIIYSTNGILIPLLQFHFLLHKSGEPWVGLRTSSPLHWAHESRGDWQYACDKDPLTGYIIRTINDNKTLSGLTRRRGWRKREPTKEDQGQEEWASPQNTINKDDTVCFLEPAPLRHNCFCWLDKCLVSV